MAKKTTDLFYKLLNSFSQKEGYKGFKTLESKAPKKFEKVKVRAVKAFEKMTGKKLKLNPTNRKRTTKDFTRRIDKLARYIPAVHKCEAYSRFLREIYEITHQRFDVTRIKDGREFIVKVPYRKDIYDFLMHYSRFKLLYELFYVYIMRPYREELGKGNKDISDISITQAWAEFVLLKDSPSRKEMLACMYVSNDFDTITFFESLASMVRRELKFFRVKTPSSEEIWEYIYNSGKPFRELSDSEEFRPFVSIMDATGKWGSTVESIDHAIGMAHSYGHNFETFRFEGKSPTIIYKAMQKFEEDFQKSIEGEKGEGRYVTTKQLDWGPKVIDYGKMFWIKLPNHYSEKEGAAGGHCGNSAGKRSDVLYSLRTEHPKKKGVFKVSMTATIDSEGRMTESKGYGNAHVASKYYKPFTDLVIYHNKNVRSVIDVSGDFGYLRANNIHFKELPFELKEVLVSGVPQAINKEDYITFKMPNTVAKGSVNGVFEWAESDLSVVKQNMIKAHQFWVEFLSSNDLHDKIKLIEVVAGYSFDRALKLWETRFKKDPRKLQELFANARMDTPNFIRLHNEEIRVDPEFMRRYAFALQVKHLGNGLHVVSKDMFKRLMFGIDAIIESERRKIDFDFKKSDTTWDFYDPDNYSYKFDSKGELVKSRNRYTGKKKIEIKAEAEKNALDGIEELLDFMSPDKEVLVKVLGKIPALKKPKYIFRAYEPDKAREILLKSFIKNSPDLAKNISKKDGKFRYHVEHAKDLAGLMANIGHGLETYSDVVEEGHVDIYYDVPSRPEDIGNYMDAVERELKRSHKEYYELNKDRIDEAQAIIDLKKDGEDLTDAQEKEYERLEQILTDGEFRANEIGAYDSMINSIESYIVDLGEIEYDKGVDLYLDAEKFNKLLTSYIDSLSEGQDDESLEDYITYNWLDLLLDSDFKMGDTDDYDDSVPPDNFMEQF